MSRCIAGHIAILLLALFASIAPAWPQPPGHEAAPLPPPLAAWKEDLDRIEKTLKQTGPNDDALVKLREQLEQSRQKTLTYVEQLKQKFNALDSQLKKLGPAPKPEEQAESEAAAKVRADISSKSSEFDGAIRTADVLQTRTAQLVNVIQERRRNLFSRQLLKRAQSPLTPGLWSRVADNFQMIMRAFGYVVSDWWAGITRPGFFAALLAVAATLWFVLRTLSRGLIARYRSYDPEQGVPPLLERTASAAGVSLARAAPPIAAFSLFVFGLSALNMFSGPIQPIGIALLYAVCIAIALMAMVRTILAPKQEMWRVFPATNRNASRLCWLAWGIAIIYGIDRFLAAVNVALAAPIPLTIAQSFITTVVVALLLAAMLRVPIGAGEETPAEEEAPPNGKLLSASMMRFALWLLVITILAAAVFGYIALARFVTTQIVVTGSILILLYLLHITVEDFAASLGDPDRPAGAWMAANFKTPAQRQSQVAIAVSLLLHLLLLAIFLPLIALQWGFDLNDLRVWVSKAVFGFDVGNWHVSLATIIVATLLFLLGLFASGLFQRWLDARVLTRAQLDQGARSAIRTGVGYLGVAVAALVAVSYAGLDFSNIAIVAGALSVGIGFGLQSIVNNFVSGLILLAERRISVGDRIVVGADEGYVRRISVRATEIETFDRNYVIIPNSELMTNAVKNWTFKNRQGRIIIDIGVSYASDPEQVKEILLNVAMEHPAIVDQEKMTVWFMDFGDSALLFRLKAFVGDVNYLLDTHSDLRYAITREFRKEGIEIPFPQRDIHLKDIDRLEAAIAGRTRPKPRSRSGK